MCIKPARQRGVTLVELIMFIIIVSVGVAGLVSVIGTLTRDSADPMIRKQMIAVAESLLNEVLQQPFTWCDPDDPAAATAIDRTTCTNAQDNAGATAPAGKALAGPMPAGEARTAFDNVADYGGFSKSDIDDIAGNYPRVGYTAAVAVTRAGVSFGLPAAEDDAALRVTVTITHAGQDPLSLNGYRFRYAPRN